MHCLLLPFAILQGPMAVFKHHGHSFQPSVTPHQTNFFSFQEKVKKLKNPKAVLKELVLMEENPAYRGMRKLIEKSFNEISNSTF